MVWKTFAARSTGSSHQFTNTPCQDAYLVENPSQDILLIAISDGAGTASRSSDGSTRIVEASLKSIKTSLSDQEDLFQIDPNFISGVISKSFLDAQIDIISFADTESVNLKEFSATLSIVALIGDWVAFGQIGDGVVVVETEIGEFTTKTRPQRGEYVNETTFITSENLQKKIEVVVEKASYHSITVMTDGLLSLATKLDKNEAYNPFFAPLLTYFRTFEDAEAGSRKLGELLESEQVSKKSDDDKSLVIAINEKLLDPKSNRID